MPLAAATEPIHCHRAVSHLELIPGIALVPWQLSSNPAHLTRSGWDKSAENPIVTDWRRASLVVTGQFESFISIALVARALWDHLAKGSGECPTGIQMQPTLETSSDSVASRKGIDTEVGRAEADKERVVCEMVKEIDLTTVGGEPQYSNNYLEWISSQKWKSYDTYDSRGRQVRVKIHPTHMDQENTMECPLPEDNLFRERSGQWTVCQDMASLTEWQTLDPSRVERTVTVMVPTEWYVNGEAYNAMTALPAVDTENLGILTCKERKMIDSGLEQLFRHDETLWSSIRGRRPSLPPGCRVFLIVLFSGMFFLGQFAHDMDVSVSFSNNQIHEARTQEDREKLKWIKIHLGLLFTDPHVTHIIPGNWDVDRCVLNSVTSLKHKFSF